MVYQEYLPHPVLAPYVRCYWSLALAPSKDLASSQRFRFLAEGVEVTFNFAGPVAIDSGDRPSRTAQTACLSGSMTRSMRMQYSGSLDLLGVCFRPGGAYPFFPCPASEIVDACTSVDDLLGSAGLRLVELVQNEATAQERVAALDAFFLAQLGGARHDDVRIRRALGSIESLGGRVSVDQLARLAGLSNRQLERRFKECVGIPPKQLCRSLRFKNVFKCLTRHPAEQWASVAASCGYYDQSHMINEFRRFTGMSPTAYFERPPGQDSLFVGNF
jgi:AraC-like DNA-binding protein